MEDGLRVASSYFTTVTADSLNPYSCGRWSQSGKKAMFTESEKDVLILILVEDGLREYHKHQDGTQKYVLILVVVEDGLREYHKHQDGTQKYVLILVVVEDGLREYGPLYVGAANIKS